MFPAIRHLRRLNEIAATLARHDALFLLDELPLPPAALMAWRTYAALPRRPESVGQSPGVRLANACVALGPTFIKLGQLLSVRPDVVGADIAADLGRLRDRLPPFPFTDARAQIEAELGQPLEILFQSVEPQPVAAASIAQVHFAVTSDGRPVAIKLLRPDVEATFRRDLDLFEWLAGLAERLAPRLRRLRPLSVVATLRESVMLELDLRLEAAAAAELAENFADDDDFRVPVVDWQRTAKRVMTMERIDGTTVDDVASLAAAGHDLRELSAKVIRTFLKQAMQHGFFHADLHHGNLFVDRAGRLVAVDFGIMGRLDQATRRFMAEMLHGFLTGDYVKVAEVHFAAGYVPRDKSVPLFAQAARAIGEPILGRPVTEISVGRLLGQLFEVTELFGMRTQPHLLLLQKTMVTVEGVARTLDPQVNFWVVSRPVVESWMGDLVGPAAIKEWVAQGRMMLRRLPVLVERLDQVDRLIGENGGLRLDDDSTRRLAQALADANRGQRWMGWTIVVLVTIVLIMTACAYWA